MSGMPSGVGIIGIDHPVIAVKDMAEARERYRRLGFTVPPRGRHREWGTGNWCIMFAADYLELRGIVDAQRYLHGLDRFLARREGLMGIAFRPESAAATYRKASALGLAASPPKELTRGFELPEGEVYPRFRLVFLPEPETLGLMASLVCEHLTPELIRRPEWLDHANGALGIAAIGSVVADHGTVEAQQRRLFGDEAVRRETERLVVDAGAGARLEFMTSREAARHNLALAGVDPPYLAQVTLRVSELAATQALLRANQVPFEMTGSGAIRVAPEHACGAILQFAET